MIERGYYDKRLKFLKEKRKEHQEELNIQQVMVNSLTSEIESCKKAMNNLTSTLLIDDEGTNTVEVNDNESNSSQEYVKFKESFIEQGIILDDVESQLKDNLVVIENQNKEIQSLKERLNEKSRSERKYKTLAKNLEKKLNKSLDKNEKLDKRRKEQITSLENKITLLSSELDAERTVKPYINYQEFVELVNNHMRDMGCPGYFLGDDCS